ncbi:peptidase family S66 [Neohortaea acidophila]|uniref:Peptidase family S66 n=1 Tax=Neohortaea acidophila TaxID=245834 RepID=A0A6A6Q5R0_9PEZI|nr:peptidase family S66 [Neohortaea acidophila]KAF2487720.1 peptidase family S66 [Neohortaea acidophila]
MNLPGTKFWPDFQDKILLLETSLNEDGNKGVPLDKVRAQLASLRNLNVFTAIKGLVVGRPAHYDDEQNHEFRQIILNQTRGTDFPILVDVDIGHTTPVLTIPLNTMVHLDSVSSTFSILEHSVETKRR